MNNPSTPALPGPWRMLILDSSGDDPKWLIATVTLGTDVRAAEMRNGRYTDWQDVTAWVRDQIGQRIRLVPVAAIVWRIDVEGNAG